MIRGRFLWRNRAKLHQSLRGPFKHRSFGQYINIFNSEQSRRQTTVTTNLINEHKQHDYEHKRTTAEQFWSKFKFKFMGYTLLSATAFWYLEKRKNVNGEEEVLASFSPEFISELNKKAEMIENDTALVETWWDAIYLYFRVIDLSIRFAPLIITYPFIQLFPSLKSVWYSLLLYTLRGCGPTFVKIGQWAASRPDLFSAELVAQLSALHNRGTTHSFEQTKEIIEEAYGKPMHEIFEEFEPEPIGSGAIAQVYKAKLKNGETVAVKVRHPNIEKNIYQDLKLLQSIARFLGTFESYKWMNLEQNVITFSKNMKEQLDLRFEAKNLVQFAKNFKEIPNIKFPSPIPQYCKELVLVESFENGIKIEEFTSLNSSRPVEVRRKLASFGMVLYLKMIVDNFLHGDLHPGNIMVTFDKSDKEQKSPKIVVLDVGLVSVLPEHQRKNLLNLFTAVCEGDGYNAADCLINKSENGENDSISKENEERFKAELSEYFTYLVEKPDSEVVEFSESFGHVLDLGRKYQISINSGLTSAIIGSIIIEGVGRQLNPEMRFIDEARGVMSCASDLRAMYFKERFSKFYENNIKMLSSQDPYINYIEDSSLM